MTDKRSLRFRRDNRSEEKFKQDIKEHTLRERQLLDLWLEEQRKLGNQVSFEDYGVNNSGEFVEESNVNPDYRLTVNGVTRLTEIKQNEYDHRNTFKVYDLEQYILFDADILLFYGLRKEFKFTRKLPETARWAIIKPEAMARMLLLPKTKGESKWGNKEVVIVWMDKFGEYFESKEFIHVQTITT